MTGEAKKDDGRKALSAWTEEIGAAFLALLRETGNARGSARKLGHPYLFDNRMRRDPAFRRKCGAATAAADARLRNPASPFARRVEVKGMPPEIDPLAGDPAPAGRRQAEAREPVIRRTSNGRTQISYVRDGFWDSAIEADFLARLRETGNFDASARAVGFDPTSVYKRLRKWPAFAGDCADAVEQASVQLDYRLIAHAHDLLRRPGEAGEADCEQEGGVPFDPDAAMRILAFIDRRRNGGTTRGRTRGPPQRSFDEAVDSVLAKIEAIERHEAMMKAREEGGREGGGEEP
jgi:hypothetical protein